MLLTTTQAAERLGVTRGTIWALANRGKIDAIKVGHDLRIEEEEIEAFKERNKVQPKEEGK